MPATKKKTNSLPTKTRTGNQTTHSKIEHSGIQILINLFDLKIWHDKSSLIEAYETLVLKCSFLTVYILLFVGTDKTKNKVYGKLNYVLKYA